MAEIDSPAYTTQCMCFLAQDICLAYGMEATVTVQPREDASAFECMLRRGERGRSFINMIIGLTLAL
jgi:hypothetical protein